MKIAKKFLRLLGVVVTALVLGLILIVLAYIVTVWLKNFFPVNVYTATLIWFVCISLCTWRVIYLFKTAQHTISLHTVAWIFGVCLSGYFILSYPIVIHERLPNVSTSIKHELHTAITYGELYSLQQNVRYSYDGLCKSEEIVDLIQTIESYGGTVTCYDEEESWAIQSSLVNTEGYYCVDSSARRELFPGSSISLNDTACGDDVRNSQSESNSAFEVREVYGQEKEIVLQMVGLVLAKMKGFKDVNPDVTEASYSTSTNSYDFNDLGVSISERDCLSS